MTVLTHWCERNGMRAMQCEYNTMSGNGDGRCDGRCDVGMVDGGYDIRNAMPDVMDKWLRK